MVTPSTLRRPTNALLDRLACTYLFLRRHPILFAAAIALFVLLLAITRWFAPLSISVYTPPAEILVLLAYLLGVLRAKGMLRYPWTLLIWSFVAKGISWTIIGLLWTPATGWWPLTEHPAYALDVLSHLLLALFSLHIAMDIEKIISVHGFFADISLIFIALCIFVATGYADLWDYLAATTTHSNLLNRVEGFYTLYSSFLVTSAILALRQRSPINVFFLATNLPFNIWLMFDAIPWVVELRDDAEKAWVLGMALFFLDMAALALIGFATIIDTNALHIHTSRIPLYALRISPLIWIGSTLSMVAVPFGYLVYQYRTGHGFPPIVGYLALGASSLAIFIRFYIMVLHARFQQTILASEAITDSLTGLYNRRGFQRMIDEHDGPDDLLCVLDIDRFKTINDTHGHTIGDEVLIHIAHCLKRHKPVQKSARIGGDEYVLILHAGHDATAALTALHDALSIPFTIGTLHIKVGISIGAAELQAQAGESFESVYHKADSALYQSKLHKNGPHLYTVTHPG